MSSYQALKARALAAQQEREADLQRELSLKAEREKQQAKDEAERRKKLEAASKEARTKELMKANEALIRGKQEAVKEAYDPFAEDEKKAPMMPEQMAAKLAAKSRPKPAQRTPSTTTASAAPVKNGSPHPARARSTNGNGTGPKAREKSPPALGRKEKAALAFAQQAKRSAGDSLFSVRALVESRDGYGSDSPGPSRSPARKPAPPAIPIRHPVQKAKPVLGKLGAMKKSLDVTSLRKLCPDRGSRDMRTIDEIQRDIRAKKSGQAGATPGVGPDGKKGSVSPVKRHSIPPPPAPARNGLATSSGTTSTPRIPTPSSASKRHPNQARHIPKHSARSRSCSSSTSTSSSSPTPPPSGHGPAKKRKRSPDYTGLSQSQISAEIQSLFRRPGAAPQPRRPVYSDEDDSDTDDMEAGLSDVEEEERRAQRIARLEDERAEREERERKALKEKMKKERERKGK